MSIQTVSGSTVTSSTTVNNGGSVLCGGTPTALNQVDLGYSDVGVFGSSVTDNNSADKAVSSGTFSYSNQKPVAKRLTEELSGVSNTALQSGASVPSLRRSIHKLEKITTRRLTTAIRDGYWNIYTGKFTTPPTVNVDPFWNNSTGTTSATSTDEAAAPTFSVPGELTYIAGSTSSTVKVPKNDNYKAKTNN